MVGLVIADAGPLIAFSSVNQLGLLAQMIFDHDLNVLEGPVLLPQDPEAADQDASLLQMRDGGLLLGSFAWYPVPAAFAEAVPWGYGSVNRTGVDAGGKALLFAAGL